MKQLQIETKNGPSYRLELVGVGNMQGRRVFIPDKDTTGNDVPKGYTDTHSIGNYGWLLKLQPDPIRLFNGYVTPK